ncbi:glycosyltransferase [Mucilaginibacter sp.]|jgi:glycosyltransferase involved in cell wall biosynthesis|uniref:glycosyltransferase n=1 Tax=Mucilaginibacter sp. TaxID=1882438 RepID=UPI0035624C99
MNINLITSVTGFPHGTATANRIKMIAKALINQGNHFCVYTNCFLFNKYNTLPKGQYEGIDFLYLHGHTEEINSNLKKLLLFLKGIIRLHHVISKLDPKIDIIYICAQGKIFNVITILLSKLYRIKVIEEINEWNHVVLNRKIEKIINEGPLIKWTDGAIVISNKLDRTIKAIVPNYTTILIPVLEDAEKFNRLTPVKENISQYCFWMGLVDGYLHDILFIIKGLGLAYKNGYNYNFTISGPYNQDSLNKIINNAAEFGYPFQNINLLGYISEDELMNQCKNAHFYIVPLADDIRSQSRFPTKVASYMFCGKPILTSKIGEVGSLLEDYYNVLYYTPDDFNSLSEKIKLLSTNVHLYKTICTNTTKFAINNFDYKIYGNRIHTFFSEILSK